MGQASINSCLFSGMGGRLECEVRHTHTQRERENLIESNISQLLYNIFGVLNMNSVDFFFVYPKSKRCFLYILRVLFSVPDISCIFGVCLPIEYNLEKK